MAMKQVSLSRVEHRAPLAREVRDSRRHQIPLRDLSECLLAAYEGVSRRALRLHRAMGAEAGSELKNWKAAERDLLGPMPVDLAESETNFYALASVPGYAAAEISVAVEDCWLLISGYGHCFEQAGFVVADGMEFDTSGIISACGESRGTGSPGENDIQPLNLQGNSRAEQTLDECVVRRPFCVVELGRKVDALRSIAVVANGMVAVRMAKADPGTPARGEKVRQ
jgi:HSP20 family molecular chaperone IbpA